MSDTSKQNLDAEAIKYHQMAPAGKLSIVATKPMANQRDLSLAYSPGVAAACMLIADDEKCPETAAGTVTARANLVGVISNGTAVLGLGNIGALASKPVMEGKAVLFKKFSGIDVFDIEVNETDVDKFCNVVAPLEPTFGGINLEDIKAPQCFEIEKQLKERMNIPVFHDDQHGTAIVVAAAVYNALELQNKKIGDVKVVCSGAGSAALASLNLLVSMGMERKNITVLDIDGVVYNGRTVGEMDEYKGAYSQDTTARTLDDAIDGADVFLGMSAGGVLKAPMVKKMAPNALILAMANPEPEIRPEEALAVRDDLIIGTGRSDYPNQANNVLCFPFIFRGALDVGATCINDEMKIATVKALAELARKESDETVASAYQGETLKFGPDYILPKPFDGRLIQEIAPAVAQAAMDSGVATRPITDMEAYVKSLANLTNESGSVMTPLTEKAQHAKVKKRVVLAEGEDTRALRASQFLVDDGIAHPVLIGRRDVIDHMIEELGLRLAEGHYDVVDPSDYAQYDSYCTEYFKIMDRRGATTSSSATLCRTDNVVIGALMVRMGHADSMICGLEGGFSHNSVIIKDLIGLEEGVKRLSAMTMLLIEGREPLCLTDTHVQYDPNPEQLVEIVSMATRNMQRFAITPKVALMSHSNFGQSKAPSAKKMRDAVSLLHEKRPDLAVDGEMHADTAFYESVRGEHVIDSQFEGRANLLVFPNLDSANISYNLLKAQTNATIVGPIMMGTAKPCHVLTPAAGARTIVNMATMLVTREF